MFKSPDKTARLVEELRHTAMEQTRIRCMHTLERNSTTNQIRRLRSEVNKDRLDRDAFEYDQAAGDRDLHHLRHEQLAESMDQQNRRIMRDQTMRQIVRQNSQELRQLEEKLRAAYVGKGVRAQLAEREAHRLQEKIQEQKDLQAMLERRKIEEEERLQAKVADQAKRVEFREALQEQMAIHSLKRQVLYEQFLAEKKAIDDIIKQIHEEKIAELHEKSERKKRFRDDQLQLREQRNAFLEQERCEMDAEYLRIAAYLAKQNAQNEERRKLDESRKSSTAAVAERMCAELDEEERKRIERRELLTMLEAEELEQLAVQRQRQALAQKLRQRIETVLAQQRQTDDRTLRKEREQEDEREFRRRQMEELAERDKIEQLSNERRRQRVADHNRVVMQMLEARRNDRAGAMARRMEEKREEEREEERMKQIVEEERIKILQEHAAELVGAFPRGVLRESDRAKLNIV